MEKNTESKRDIRSDACEPSFGDKRHLPDRRKNKKARLKYLLFNGRRERIRRAEDREKTFFFDRYNQKLFAAITAILMLSICDALLTLILIDGGASEVNPVMAYFLQYGPLPFIIAKYILTSFGVIILLIFKNTFLTKVRVYTYSLFSCVILAFSTVIAWQLFLIFTAL